MSIQNQTLKELKELCKKNNFKNYSNLNKTELIKFIKKNMKGGLILGNNNLQRLLSLHYSKINTEKIVLQNKGITRIDIGMTFYNLKELDLSNNKIILCSERDKGITNMEAYYMGEPELGKCNPVFNNMPNLISLNLSNNNIKMIAQGVFNGLIRLENLNLSNNKLEIIKYGAFDGLSNLKKLYLYGSDIKIVEKGAFNNLTQLLELGFNNIEQIKSGILNGLSSNLIKLVLSGSKLKKIESETFNAFHNLKELDLSFNDFTSIEKGAFNGLKKLEVLNLSLTQLTEIEQSTFNGLSSLKELYLTQNYNLLIKKGAFYELTNLTKLDMRGTKFEEEIFYGLDNLDTLELSMPPPLKIKIGQFDGLYNLKHFTLTEEDNMRTLERSRRHYMRVPPTYLYNKYFNLYKKCKELNDNKYKNRNIIIFNNTKSFHHFYDIFRTIYNNARNKVYETLINQFNGKIYAVEINDINIKNIFENSKGISNNNIIRKFNLLDNSGNIISDLPIKKYLFKTSKFINATIDNTNFNNTNSNSFEIKLLNVDNGDIVLIGEYLKNNGLIYFNKEELLQLLKASDYLYIQDKELMSKLFLKIYEIIKDYDVDEIISFFHLTINKNIKNEQNCRIKCKNKKSTIIGKNNKQSCGCSISG